jgi:hypothetical protein
MWNRGFVRAHYPRQVAEFLAGGPDGTLSVKLLPPVEMMGRPVATDTCDFGWVAAWASEMGDEETLRGLLAHADRFMAPAWRDGGLHYPRNDTPTDPDGNRTEIEPMSGNVLLGYARLNVPDGLWGLYNAPWGPAHFEEPAVTAVSRDVDVSRAAVVDRALAVRVQRDPGVPGDGTVTLGRVLGRGRWRLTRDGVEVARIDGAAVQHADTAGAGEDVRAGDDGLVLHCPDGAPRDLVLEPAS